MSTKVYQICVLIVHGIDLLTVPWDSSYYLDRLTMSRQITKLKAAYPGKDFTYKTLRLAADAQLSETVPNVENIFNLGGK